VLGNRQDGDSTRPTISIIKTCIVTIFTCTWTIQHLNVPASNDGELRRLLRVCKWMLITILLPEFILAKALLERALAAETMGMMCAPNFELRREYPRPETPSSHQSARLSWLDGTETEPKPDEETQPAGRSPNHPHSKFTWTPTHAYLANMGGFVYTPPTDDPALPGPVARPLTGIQLAGFFDLFDYPNITKDEIKDKSKTDVLAKVFSVFQVSHLLLSFIVRRAQGLPSSQLEILTLAFAVCGVATYAAYWHKPKDVAVPFHLSISPNHAAQVHLRDHSDASAFSRLATSPSFDSFWKVATNHRLNHGHEALYRVPNDNIPIYRSGRTHTATFLLAFVSAVFGSLHAIAWDFDFPTVAEKTVWHVCTILSITLPPLGLLGIPLSQATHRQGSPRDFLYASVRVLRELSWQLDMTDEKRATNMVRLELEKIYNSDLAGARNTRSDQVRYGDILWPEENRREDRPLRQKMLDFVDKKAPFQDRPDLDLPPGYARHLHRLVRLMNGEGSKKMVDEIARTNVFPRAELPTAFNIGLVYVTMGLYCVARLTLIAVGLSSLRAMPEPVYKSTWADYLPAI
jgi:hypothetical protein